MANNLPSPLEACRVDLFTDEAELKEKYPLAIAERVLRVREMYNYWLANPSMKDRQLRDAIMSRFSVSQSTAYSDIAVIHQLAPLLSQKSRDFHRERVNEMLLETYAMAKARKDTKTMERTAATYSKNNRCQEPDEQIISFEDLHKQPFVPVTDPTVIGIKPIPNVYDYIARLKKDLMRDFPDIVDVSYEETDLEENFLFDDDATTQS